MVVKLFCLMTSLTYLTACTPSVALEGLPQDIFQKESLYTGPLNTVGDLSKGYVNNTNALRAANNKISVICVAANRCSGDVQ